MLKDPVHFLENVLDEIAELLPNLTLGQPLHRNSDIDAATHELLDERHTQLLDALEEPYHPEAFVPFRMAAVGLMLEDAKTIEAGRWSLLPDLYRIAGKNQLMALYLACVHCLVGTEKYFLLGTRGNRPAFKRLSPPVTLTQLAYYGGGASLANVDQNDLELWPPIHEHYPGFQRLTWPTTEPVVVAKLLEEAHYRQRYVVNPAGAYVRLQHFGPLRGMTLKVKPGVRDPNYIDLIACFEVEVAPSDANVNNEPQIMKAVIVLDGAELVNTLLGSLDAENLNMTYLLWVVALIYHDLVTAEEIAVGAPPLARTDSQAAPPPEEEEAKSWVYIPRKVKNRPTEIRYERENYRPMTPHHVSGHLRKGKLSEDHREELSRFERETGLKVLELLDRNPGYTFVRPHVSPLAEGLKELPRFIHARLQSDIDRLAAGLPKGRPNIQVKAR